MIGSGVRPLTGTYLENSFDFLLFLVVVNVNRRCSASPVCPGQKLTFIAMRWMIQAGFVFVMKFFLRL
ncbi:hypothetical protein GJA_1192 [Janthinobacterium agaricidamnosum NBRC 102515 = DSM 9628]|uniref:Uncharacterized protein n=1 Tax=Janthinobacterium agaricidamnosum NBRC 102515 = DSM 9628 TaxID=1349767 RepID=W0V2K5_9BURK|nr:hypothetical protein GJA_1192 [Janthinobacterium agaricidamnosum NBRC 102515 = DSM 9628]